MEWENILLVRVSRQESVNGWELRDYILGSLARGVLVLKEDTSCEVMELPPGQGADFQGRTSAAPLPIAEWRLAAQALDNLEQKGSLEYAGKNHTI